MEEYGYYNFILAQGYGASVVIIRAKNIEDASRVFLHIKDSKFHTEDYDQDLTSEGRLKFTRIALPRKDGDYSSTREFWDCIFLSQWE